MNHISLIQIEQNEPVYYAEFLESSQLNQKNIHIEYQVEQILDHRFKLSHQGGFFKRIPHLLKTPPQLIPDLQLQFLIKWRDQEQLTWQPAQNLKNAPQILEKYKRYFQQRKAMSTKKTYTGKTRGRKPKNATANTGNIQANSAPRNIESILRKFSKKKNENPQQLLIDDDEIQFIDKQTYIKQTRQVSQIIRVDDFKIFPNQEKSQEKPTNLPSQILSAEVLRQERIGDNDKNQFRQTFCLNQQKAHRLNELQKVAQCQQQEQTERLSTLVCKQKVPIIQEHSNKSPQSKKLNERSILLIQEQNHSYQSEQKSIRRPLSEIFQQKNFQQRRKQPIDPSLSSAQRLIDLFIETQKKHSQSYYEYQNRNYNDQHELNENEKFSIQKIQNVVRQSYQFNQKNNNENMSNNNPFERFNNEEDEQQNITLPKRILDKEMVEQQQGQKPNKKIKKDQVASVENTFRQYGLINHKNDKKVLIIDLQQDQRPQVAQEQQKEPQFHVPLKTTIHNELFNLLNKIKPNIDEILTNEQKNDSSLIKNIIKPKQIKKSQKRLCDNCQIHEQYNNQLRKLFTQLIQSSQQINFDNIFLQQQTFAVLSSLNPNSHNNTCQKFLRIDKMTDLTGKEPICSLISSKIAKKEDIEDIIKHYNLSKIIKVKGEWFGIFIIKSLGQKQEHFKYVNANQVLQISRETIVSFLIN